MAYSGRYSGQQIDDLLEQVEQGGGGVTVDSEMSDTSENPVQNKVVKDYVDSAISEAITNTLNTAV